MRNQRDEPNKNTSNEIKGKVINKDDKSYNDLNEKEVQSKIMVAEYNIQDIVTWKIFFVKAHQKFLSYKNSKEKLPFLFTPTDKASSNVQTKPAMYLNKN